VAFFRFVKDGEESVRVYRTVPNARFNVNVTLDRSLLSAFYADDFERTRVTNGFPSRFLPFGYVIQFNLA
jgi:hypothetical protein